jgi:radical SAM protein with 4Fe4S-binding SPASM domain
MIRVLNEELLEALKRMQSTLAGVDAIYQVPQVSDFSCVRCSGSAGRFVYEKQNGDAPNKPAKTSRFSPSLCITHACNLNCVYCYQKHRAGTGMSFDTAKGIIDWVFANIPPEMNGVEFTFIGGEPLLEFDLIKKIMDYTCKEYDSEKFIFYAASNGVLLNPEMKQWFIEHRDKFYLRLSLDGTKETHDYNRSNSFDKLDIDFFKNTWPGQGVKMTLSEFSLRHLARDIKYIHSLGFDEIGGVNLAEGDFDWNKDEYIRILVPQLEELVEYYATNPDIRLDQLFDRRLDLCEAQNKSRKKRCGIGIGTLFFDVNGTRYPCTFITPMTFSKSEIENAMHTDFSNDDNFIDEECFNHCYLYPICPTCSGSNYMVNKTFKTRNKNKCRLQKIVALFIADLQGKMLLKESRRMDDTKKYYTIEAIKKIKCLYYPYL